MVAIDIDGTITTYSQIPSVWNGVLNYNSINNTENQMTDGWREVVQPDYDTSLQKRGDIYFNVANDNFTYAVIDLTDEEIQARLVSQAEGEKQNIIQQMLEKQVTDEAQLGDDSSALDNQALFPMWEFPFDYVIDFKCQSFTDTNELVLYKCVQAHTSQSDWNPNIVPALFTRVAYPDEILVFIQPTGAQDAYNIGDKVYYPTINNDIYESVIDANVWSPDAHPAGWQIL